MIASVACRSTDRLAAMTLLEDEDDDAERNSQRHEVEQHRLQRQEHRPEGAHQQDEGQQHHDQQHPDEVAVDRMHEVAVAGRDAAEGQPAEPRARAPVMAVRHS